MKLNALPGREPQRVVAVGRGEFIEGDPLRGGHDAAGNAAPDHHLVFFARFAQVAVILLIGAVKLQKLGVIVRKAIGGRVGHSGGEVAREGRIVRLEDLVVGQFCGFGSGHEI